MNLFQLFYTFFKIGLFSFGGGYGTIPLIEGEIVAKGAITEEAFVKFIGIAESTPGPFAVNIATFVGAEVGTDCLGTSFGGFLGSLLATTAVVLPAFIIMLVPSSIGAPLLPWHACIGVSVILARELIVSGFRMVAASKGTVLAADKSGKVKTFTQDVAVVVLLVSAGISFNPLYYFGLGLFFASVILTVISGVECLTKNASVLKD